MGDRGGSSPFIRIQEPLVLVFTRVGGFLLFTYGVVSHLEKGSIFAFVHQPVYAYLRDTSLVSLLCCQCNNHNLRGIIPVLELERGF